MATLKEKLDEMARIKAELQRMETSEETTEEEDGDYRDTLVARWTDLDGECKPIIKRMENIRAITRTADDEGNLERPDGGSHAARNGSYGAGPDLERPDGGSHAARNGSYGAGPDLQVQNRRSPYEDLDAVRSHMVRTPELRGRALDAIELEAKRGVMVHDHAEAATRMVQDNIGREGRGIAEHILTTGSEEYQDAFNAYLEKPQQNATRAALSLTQANGGYLLPFVLDQLVA